MQSAKAAVGGGVSLSECAQAFRAMGDETRLGILLLLARGPRAAGEIVAEFDLAQSTISRHLTVLKQAGLVRASRSQQHIIYELVPGALGGRWKRFATEMNGR